jgi:hypothetical protein
MFLLSSSFTLVSCLAYSSTLKLEATCISEISANFQQTTQRYITEDKTPYSFLVHTAHSTCLMIASCGAETSALTMFLGLKLIHHLCYWPVSCRAVKKRGAVAPTLENADPSNPTIQVPEIPTFYYYYYYYYGSTQPIFVGPLSLYFSVS